MIIRQVKFHESRMAYAREKVADMRFKNPFVMALFLVALCASNAYSIGDSIGKSADQLIDESNGIHSHDIYHPENPQEARTLWSLQHGTNFTMPDTVLENSIGTSTGFRTDTRTSTSPEEPLYSANSSESLQNQIAGATNASQTTLSQGVAALNAANAAGNWSFRLRDSKKNRVLALTLFQSYNAVFGTGRINDGGDTLEVMASGSVEGDKLYLEATSSGTIILYRLALTESGNTASGEYRAFSTGNETWKGLADGVRIPSGQPLSRIEKSPRE